MSTSDGVVYSIDDGKTKFYDLLQLVEFYQLNSGNLPTRYDRFLKILVLRNMFNSRLKHYIVNADYEKSKESGQNGTEPGDREPCHISRCDGERPGSPASEAEVDSAMSQVSNYQKNWGKTDYFRMALARMKEQTENNKVKFVKIKHH